MYPEHAASLSMTNSFGWKVIAVRLGRQSEARVFYDQSSKDAALTMYRRQPPLQGIQIQEILHDSGSVLHCSNLLARSAIYLDVMVVASLAKLRHPVTPIHSQRRTLRRATYRVQIWFPGISAFFSCPFIFRHDFQSLSFSFYDYSGKNWSTWPIGEAGGAWRKADYELPSKELNRLWLALGISRDPEPNCDDLAHLYTTWCSFC